MFYKVEIILNFRKEEDTEDLIDKALDVLENAVVINPGQPNEERGYIDLQQCFHDEDPIRSCVVLKHIEPEG